MLNTVITVAITVIVTSIVTCALTYAKTVSNSAKSVKEGVLSLLRLMIIQHHDKYVEQGYCSINDKGVIEKAYNAYHNLGGNGAITTYYQQIMSLPDRKD
jgi:hypothetical protein